MSFGCECNDKQEFTVREAHHTTWLLFSTCNETVQSHGTVWVLLRSV